MDLFASRLTALLPQYASWKPDPDPGLGSSKRLLLSTIQSDFSIPEKGIPGQSRCGLSGASVSGTALVASPSGSPNGEPCNDPQRQAPPKRPYSPSTCTPDVPQAPPSHLSHIRENHQAEGFSEDVTNILLSATCQSTNKTYQSSWGMWCGWCCKRKVNPISASPSDVLLFLTDRFNNVAAYQSVNVAWSSISSAHPKIDGHPGGQHP